MNGADAWYECVSVIQHSGVVSSSTDSRGHYICDVKEAKSGIWFRTHDDSLPNQICTDNVLKEGYAYLLKRTDL